MDLLGDSDVEEDEKQAAEINTDNSYATSYDTWRQKEHIQKLKDKYGDDYEEEDAEDSDESSDDSGAEELDDEMEKESHQAGHVNSGFQNRQSGVSYKPSYDKHR